MTETRQGNNEKQITLLTSDCPHLVPHIQPACEAVEVVEVAAEVDETLAQDLPHPGGPGHDGGGGVVAEHDGGVTLVLGLLTGHL